MSMTVSVCAVLLDEILNLIESVSEGFPTYFTHTGLSPLVRKMRKARYVYKTKIGLVRTEINIVFFPASREFVF